MQLPNWLKILWWLLLLGALTFFLHSRYPDLIAGKASPADIVVFLIWIALLLAPLFSEVTLLGISLKQDIKDLKESVSTQVAEIRSEVRNAVDVRTTFSPHFNIPAPASDAQLPDLEARIKAALSEALATHGVGPQKNKPTLEAPDDVALLFAARYGIERELRRIVDEHEMRTVSPDIRRRAVPVFQLVRKLVTAEIIEPKLASAISEVYSVCSPGIHGEPVTEAQVTFVREVAPELISALKAV